MPASVPFKPVAASRPLPDPPAGAANALLVATADATVPSGFTLAWVEIPDDTDTFVIDNSAGDVVTIVPA